MGGRDLIHESVLKTLTRARAEQVSAPAVADRRLQNAFIGSPIFEGPTDVVDEAPPVWDLSVLLQARQ